MPKSFNKKIRYLFTHNCQVYWKIKYSIARCIENRLIIWYWSIELSLGSFLGKILRWDRPCANKFISSIFHYNSVLFWQASNFRTCTMEDTDHKDVWQCGTFPWSQSLSLVELGPRGAPCMTKLNQKEMVVTFCGEDLTTRGHSSADLASQVMFSL